jgi:hypothetical protein
MWGNLKATPGRGCVARSNPDADILVVEKTASVITGCTDWTTVGLTDGRRLTSIL